MMRHALSIFDEVVTLDAAARTERLAQLHSSNRELHDLVARLLAADQRADDSLANVESSLRSLVIESTRRSTDPDPLQLVGQTVTHFRVIAPLAAGGMGIVYRAEDTQLKRAIALKFPQPHLFFDPGVRERFLREARLAGALDHPNICPIYEAGESAAGHIFYAMPLYEGETLRARIAREGVLAPAVALTIATQIAQGLSAAHRVGIMHRDLKPANVMLLPDDSVKILDFGLARTADVRLTASALRLGTAAYMAPEQIEGGAFDARVDLWALGVLLYEMLTGRLPFEGEHDIAMAHAIVTHEPLPPSMLRPELPSGFDDVVLKLLAKDPARRPATADDLQALAVAQPRRRARLPVRKLASRATILMALVSGAWFAQHNSSGNDQVRMVAVLPLQAASNADDYVAVGLADAIATELSRVRGMAVPNAASALVRATNRTIPLTGNALAPAAVLRGKVRREDGEVRSVELELVDVASQKRVWSHRYPGNDLHQIERDAVRRVAAALRVPLNRSERAALRRPVVTSARAYDLYLQGRAAELDGYPRSVMSGMPSENIRRAQSLYSRARAIDPSFAQARARLANMLMYGAFRYDTTQARRDHARLEAEAALRLHPGLAEAHEALAYYWSWQDLPRAIEEAQKGIAVAPNQSDAHGHLAMLYRDAGRWEDAVAEFEQAVGLDPANLVAAAQAAFTLLRLRRDEESMRHMNRIIQLTPNDHMIKVIKGHTYLRWQGDVDTLDAVMRSVPRDWDPGGMATWARFTALWVQRRHTDALAMLDATRAVICSDRLVYQPVVLMRAQIYEAMGERAQARTHYRAAHALLADSVAARPRDASRRAALALALVGLGRNQEAVQEARRAIEHTPLTRANPAATAFMGIAVEVFARAGALDDAFELLELLLAMPAGREVTIPYVRLWPGFDALRNDARLDPLLERFAS